MQSLWTEVDQRRNPWEMNVYDLLRKLIAGGQWTEEEREGAKKLVDDLQSVGVFGSSAEAITEKGEG